MNNCERCLSMPVGSGSNWSELLTIFECTEDLRWLCDDLTDGGQQGQSLAHEHLPWHRAGGVYWRLLHAAKHTPD